MSDSSPGVRCHFPIAYVFQPRSPSTSAIVPFSNGIRAENPGKPAAPSTMHAMPFDELIWGPVKVLGVDSVATYSLVMKVEARTTPGKSPQVARALRQRLKQAFDDAGVKIKDEAVTVSSTPVAAVEIAAPSALSDPLSPQSAAVKPIPAQSVE